MMRGLRSRSRASLEPRHELLISLVLDARADAQLADLQRAATDAATIDDVRRMALRLRALRHAWREIAMRSRRLTGDEHAPSDHRCENGAVRIDIRVITTEPLVDGDAISYEDARDKLEALSCALVGNVTALEVNHCPTALRSDSELLDVPPWPVSPSRGVPLRLRSHRQRAGAEGRRVEAELPGALLRRAKRTV